MQDTNNKRKQIDDFCCPITRATFTHPIVTRCGHTFDKDVLETHLKQASTCPMCMRRVTMDDTCVRDVHVCKSLTDVGKLEHRTSFESQRYRQQSKEETQDGL